MANHYNTYTDVLVGIVGTAVTGTLAFIDVHPAFMSYLCGAVTIAYISRKWYLMEKRKNTPKQ